MTKPIIVVRVPCKLLYVIQVKEFLIKCLTSWPYLISEFLVAYITIVASDWPRTFFTPKVFLFSIVYYLHCLSFVRALNITNIVIITLKLLTKLVLETVLCFTKYQNTLIKHTLGPYNQLNNLCYTVTFLLHLNVCRYNF